LLPAKGRQVGYEEPVPSSAAQANVTDWLQGLQLQSGLGWSARAGRAKQGDGAQVTPGIVARRVIDAAETGIEEGGCRCLALK